MTPPHLKPLPLNIVLALSKHVSDTGSCMQTVRVENLEFGATCTPHDAGRVAKALRYLITQATAAALAFEAAAQVKGDADAS